MIDNASLCNHTLRLTPCKNGRCTGIDYEQSNRRHPWPWEENSCLVHNSRVHNSGATVQQHHLGSAGQADCSHCSFARQRLWSSGEFSCCLAGLCDKNDTDTVVQDWTAARRLCLNIVARVKSSHAAPFPPDHFVCPITYQLMEDPVLISTSSTGKSFEREATQEHFAQRMQDHTPLTDPWSNQKVQRADLTPNLNLKEAIEDYKLHALHYSIPMRLAGATVQL